MRLIDSDSPPIHSLAFVRRCCAPRDFTIDSGGHVLLTTTHAGCSLLQLPVPRGTVQLPSVSRLGTHRR